MSTWSSTSLQLANSPIMEFLFDFHEDVLTILLLINTMIFYIMTSILFNKFNNKFITHNQMIEIIWTILPMLILMIIALPSLELLYLSDEIFLPLMSIKCLGHQWYWKYEYSDFKNIEFNSFMLSYDYNNLNMFRLLDVDNRLIIPYNINLRFLISSIDVIHSWTIPSLGMKVDAIPGRINQVASYLDRPGIYFGQCSEICGMNHSFMPIVIESTSENLFINWIYSQ